MKLLSVVLMALIVIGMFLAWQGVIPWTALNVISLPVGVGSVIVAYRRGMADWSTTALGLTLVLVLLTLLGGWR